MKEHFEGSHAVDRHDPLTVFDSEQDGANFSSSSKTTTFSALAEFGEECHSPADTGGTPAAPLNVLLETSGVSPTIFEIAAVGTTTVETAAGALIENTPAPAGRAARERRTVTAPTGAVAGQPARRSAAASETKARAAAAALPRSMARERAKATASIDAARRQRPTAAPASSRVRWAVSLVVLIPPVATLLFFGTPLLSTAVIPGIVVAGTIGVQQEANRDLAALLPNAPAPPPAPRATDPVVTEALTDVLRTEPIVPAIDERRHPAAQEPSQPAASPRRSSAAVTRAESVRLASEGAARPPVQSPAVILISPIAPLEPRLASAPPIQTPERRGFQGTINVDTAPGGAHVSVDGRYVGMTPVVWEVSAGSHVVRIEREGYERWSGAVQAVAEKTVKVAVTLLPARQP